MRNLEDRRFLGLLEAAPDAMVCVTGDGRIALVNAQAEGLFGYERAELIGQRVELLVPEAVGPVTADLQAACQADPKAQPTGHRLLRSGLELEGRRKDGSTFPAEISLSAIDTDEGVLVTAAIRDISERHLIYEADARLASIVHSSHEAIVGKTPDFVVTSWNPAAERLYGYTAQEMIGQQVHLLYPPEDLEREKRFFSKVLQGARVQDHLARRIRKDGTEVHVSVTSSPITNPAGEITGIFTVVHDVSGRQKAQARFVGLLEAAPDAMVCVEGDGRIALVNAQTERLFCYERDELIGQPVEILVPGSVRAVHPEYRARYVSDPQPRPMGLGMELAGYRKDGSTFPAEISLSAIETEEGLLVTAAIRDVTERLEAQAERERLKTQAERDRLERQLQQSQRLESLGQLAGGVAHDFNNLLGVITSYAAFVAEDVTKPEVIGLSEEVTSDIEQVQLAAQRAAGLTHQLLAFARREIVQPQIMNLNDTVASVYKLLERTIGEHVELVTELDPGLGFVIADPGRIEQILVNLAVNSRDAMPRGGKLTIATANTEVDEAYARSRANLAVGRYAALKVSDTGTGMSPEVVDRAFEPFFTTKPKGEGSGLGLATIYGIVTQAGGTVRIYSEPGLGTTVTVLLPKTELEQPADDAGSGWPQGGGNELVLVVEDESALREVTRRILAKNGYRVIVAANGQEAIDAATTRTERIDVLLTDVVMPGMQGKEVAERVTKLQPDVLVLYMSGYTEGLLSAQGVLEPGINLVEKPFTEASLLKKMHALLRASRAT